MRGEDPVTTSDEVGICVSGGGIRAASFGLGALQALQQGRGLLRGENSARYLSAVSGGSYIAGAYVLLSCSDRIRPAGTAKGTFGAAPGEGSEAPFAPGSAETEHLRRHCRYMLENGGAKMSALLVTLMILNLVAVVAIVMFVGSYIGFLANLGSRRLPQWLDPATGALWVQWIAAAICLGGILLFAHLLAASAARARSTKRTLMELLLVVAVVVASAEALVVRLDAIPVLASPAWLLNNAATVALWLCALMAVVGLTALLSRRFRHVAFLQRLDRIGVSLLTLRLVQVSGLLIVSWWAVQVYEHFGPTASAIFGLLFLVAIGGPFLVSRFVDRASPHHVYRDLLIRCFSIVRRTDGEAVKPQDPRAIRLSELKPPGRGEPASFPELLICAAVNVSDIGATPAGSNVLSLGGCPEPR
jgi:uncharacterized membrane protein YqhA